MSEGFALLELDNHKDILMLGLNVCLKTILWCQLIITMITNYIYIENFNVLTVHDSLDFSLLLIDIHIDYQDI